MRALRLVATGEPLRDEDVELAPLGADDVTVAVAAAGICRSDVHYRAGTRAVPRLPLTPGHEIAGRVVDVGSEVRRVSPGDRVAVHYQVSCGRCGQCSQGREQFCSTGEMIGLARDGGYAEAVVVPERNAFALPETISFAAGAIMMCSSVTSLHALRRGGLVPGERVAVFGCGGLGVSAIKLAFALGASVVYGVDVNDEKLQIAARLGARPVPFSDAATVRADVALELVGLPETMRAAVDSLAVHGRAVAVGITHEPFSLDSFGDLVLREAQVIGAADHTAAEVDELIDMAGRGDFDVADAVTATVALDAAAVNEAMDRLAAFQGGVRTVITP